MDTLASMFVGKPLNILAVAIALLAAYLALPFARSGDRRRFTSLLVASVAWGLYAGWEWLVRAKTPDADIRVDLLVIWPALALLSAWALFRVVRPR